MSDIAKVRDQAAFEHYGRETLGEEAWEFLDATALQELYAMWTEMTPEQRETWWLRASKVITG